MVPGWKGASSPEATSSLYDAVRDHCKVTVAEYMVPHHYMIITEVPLSSNGKVQREKLPLPAAFESGMSRGDGISAADNKEFTAASSELELSIQTAFLSVLNLPSTTSIDCVRTTFFELGGNSISAIKLIFLLKSTTASLTEAGKKGIITVQQLFSSPTIRGIARILLPTHGGASEADVSVGMDDSPAGLAEKVVQTIQANLDSMHKLAVSSHTSSLSMSMKMQLLCLSPGEIGSIPIILVNPAGASGMVYREFASHMDKKRPIFALDDGCIMAPSAGPNQYSFTSIREVAAECLIYIQQIVRQYLPGKKEHSVYLAGWSYGGTVVAEIAQQLKGVADSIPITVRSVVLFDAPLRRSVEFDKHDQQLLTQHANTHSRVAEKKSTNAGDDGGDRDAEGDSVDNNEANAHQHYLDCTRLLQQYHQRPPLHRDKINSSNDTCGSILTCPILDIRPDGLNGSDSNTDLSELTIDNVCMKTLADCSHFTMLLGQNAKQAAQLVEEFYSEQLGRS